MGETREEFISRQGLDASIQFHWICTQEKPEDVERMRTEVEAGNIFVYAPEMWVYYKVEDSDVWARGVFRFDPKNSPNMVVWPVPIKGFATTVEEAKKGLIEEEVEDVAI